MITAQVSAGNVGDRAGLSGLMYFSKTLIPKTVFVDLGYRGKEFAKEMFERYGSSYAEENFQKNLIHRQSLSYLVQPSE